MAHGVRPSLPFPVSLCAHNSIALTLCVVSVIGFTSCLHIPAESIKLNQTVKANMIDFRQKHIELAHAYFRLRRDRFDEWFLTTYEPRFFENYKKAFQQERGIPFDSSNAEHRTSYMKNSIAEYDELIGELNKIESELVNSLDEGYGKLVDANDAVTALLESSKNLTDAQKQFYDQTVGKLIPPLEADKVDAKIVDLQNKALQILGAR
jgi:hypothetical protein